MLNHIREQQRRWAESCGLVLDRSGYTAQPGENLPWLTAKTEQEFRAGDGYEFGRNGKPGKITALHSSSALAVNVFDYWRERDPAPVAETLGLAYPHIQIGFEE